MERTYMSLCQRKYGGRLYWPSDAQYVRMILGFSHSSVYRFGQLAKEDVGLLKVATVPIGNSIVENSIFTV